MSYRSARYLVVGTVLSFTCSVFAQEVVHALTGVVTQVDNTRHFITLKSSDGSQVVLQEDTKRSPEFEFDKALQADTTSSTDSEKRGDPVIVYYFGEDIGRRVVA